MFTELSEHKNSKERAGRRNRVVEEDWWIISSNNRFPRRQFPPPIDYAENCLFTLALWFTAWYAFSFHFVSLKCKANKSAAHFFSHSVRRSYYLPFALHFLTCQYQHESRIRKMFIQALNGDGEIVGILTVGQCEWEEDEKLPEDFHFSFGRRSGVAHHLSSVAQMSVWKLPFHLPLSTSLVLGGKKEPQLKRTFFGMSLVTSTRTILITSLDELDTPPSNCFSQVHSTLWATMAL